MTDAVRRLVLIVVVGAVTGLLVALLIVPIAGGMGVLSNDAAHTWTSQACGLEEHPLPQRTRIVAADGSLIASFYYQNRVTVGIDDMPLPLRKAVLATEDARFYAHNGFDVKGTVRAALKNSSSGGISQGGSTLTQQYVKNLFLMTARNEAERKAATADTFERKLREARCALELEQKMSKDDILAGYLNIAYFGQGAYGVAAAALRYFNKPVQKLTLAQSALLAGMLKNPYGYDPVRFPDRARDRRAVVLMRMRQVGFVTPEQEKAANLVGLTIKLSKQRNGCEASRAPHFCQWVFDLIKNDPAFGDSPEARDNALWRGGLTIRTTLDWTTQHAAEQALTDIAPSDTKNNPRRIGAAEVMMQPGTGNVLAMAVNLPYGHDAGSNENENNYATGGSTGFQAGSTFKMFTLVTALENGYSLRHTINAPQRYCSDVFKDGNDKPYCPENADINEGGHFSILKCTAGSVNTCFVRLEEDLGVLEVADTARAMGVNLTKFTPYPPSKNDGSFTLGTWEVSPLEMAEAYATLAASGKHCAARGIVSATDADGKAIAISPPKCRQVIDADLADTATKALTHVINGPEPHTGSRANIDRPAAGKTGTTQGYGAAWFCGYTPQLAAAVWMGDPLGPAHPLRDIRLGDVTKKKVFGGDFPAMIWAASMKDALTGSPVAEFPEPDESQISDVGGSWGGVVVPDVYGMDPAEALATIKDAGLTASVSTTNVTSKEPAGTVAYTSPGVGKHLPYKDNVTIFVSSGDESAPPSASPPSGTSTPSAAPPSGGPSAAPPTGGAAGTSGAMAPAAPGPGPNHPAGPPGKPFRSG